ncbi:ATP-binding protein [Streptomyces litchfieldiae]|uniref:Tetratricopeptide repeat protein n=1 Tax=Streptomyces litchfieldiae TaxID=3075543 RepID=A0ABU2MMW3_9ACTN|nr:tetratricopeptide repeat protein [Streptomyces sp. DSM 44938]MDT0342278.1 tetratricopeptide repeat protein [Streptomyces sp. DSM 44938]
MVQAGHVSGGIHFHGGDDSRFLKPRQLPGDVRGFVNRTEELDRLNAILPDAEGDPFVVSVCVIAGTAGAGKTSLALRWAHQVQGRFPDGQLYVNLRGYDPADPVTPQEALHRFLTALGVPAASVPEDLDAAAALYRSLLADRRTLIVLDNAATAAQVRPLLPGSPGCLAVVTSRSRLSGLAIRDGAQRLTLGTLPEPEAVALLRAVTAGYRPEDDAGKLSELARLCARLPLALRIAAERAATHPHLRLEDLIAELRDETALWDALSASHEDEADGVRTVFAWSYRALPTDAARLFRLLGLHPGPEFGLHVAATLAGAGVGRTRQLLDMLVGAHLLEQTGPDRYEFHDLLRAFATDQARLEEPAAQREAALCRVLDWYLHTADAAQSWLEPNEAHQPLVPPDGTVTPLSFPDYDAAVSWAEREHTNLLAAVKTAQAEGLDRYAAQLPAVLWNAQAPSASALDWFEAGRIGLAAARRLGERAAEAALLEDLGMSHTRLNRLAESQECHEGALIIRRELGDRDGEANSLNLLGLTHLHRRQLTAAREYFEQAIAIYRDIGAAHFEAVALANLAETHYRAGRLAEAEETGRGALVSQRAAGNRGSQGNILRTLSDIQAERGQAEEALSSAQEAVDIALSLRNQFTEAIRLISLGNAQLLLGRYAEALDSYQRSAALHRRLRNRSREALAWLGAGRTYYALQRPEEAADFHRQAAAAFHDLGDPWHEALARDDLARALRDERPDRAREHWAEALRLLAGYDDPRAVTTRERIAGHLTDPRA